MALSSANPARREPLDPGWLFIVAGLMTIGATVLIPAADDLSEAQFLRERAKLVQGHRDERLERYENYLGALERHEPPLVLSLAASQLNQIPADRSPFLLSNSTATTSASVYPALEPAPLRLSERHKIGSTLERWTTDSSTRLWLIAGGAVCVLVGLLPKARR